MIYLIEYLPDYKDKAISELKTMREQEIDPSLIILTKSLEGKMQTEYEILKGTFTRYKKFEKMWDMA